MIFMMLGRPGGGKSYESVVYHLIPSLKDGRKVITNLPLKLDYFRLIFGDELTSLIEIKNPTHENPRPFQKIDDYGDTWTHPISGVGPLYIIDECHKPLRRGKTDQIVEEWFAEHRHSKSDVLLITQSHRKIDANICDLVDIVYTVGKATALGSQERYVRATKTGVRGTVLDTQIRTYDETYFPFYKSHTASSVMGKEATIKDIKPIWKNWQFTFSAIFLIVGLLTVAFNAKNLLIPDSIKQDPEQAQLTNKNDFNQLASTFESFNQPINQSALLFEPTGSTELTELSNKKPQQIADHPYKEFQIRISGHVRVKDNTMTVFRLLQNGQTAFMLRTDDIVASGYQVDYISDCLVYLTHGSYSQHVTCGYATSQVMAPM